MENQEEGTRQYVDRYDFLAIDKYDPSKKIQVKSVITDEGQIVTAIFITEPMPVGFTPDMVKRMTEARFRELREREQIHE